MLELLIAAILGGGAVAGAQYLGSKRIGAAKPAGDLRGSSTVLGHIPLVASKGLQRYATYRGIFLTNPWVYSAVTKLAQDLARLPTHVYALDEAGERRRVRSDVPTRGPRSAAMQLDWILHHPVGLSQFAFWRGLMIDRLIYGNALAEIIRGSSTSAGIEGLQRIRWRNVAWVEEDADGLPLYYEIRKGKNPYGTTRRIGPDDVIHFGRGVDPENPCAPSPLESAQHTIALYEAVVRHLKAYFENAARPSGHIEVDGNLTADRAREIRKMLEEVYTSPENAGKILVTSGKWQTTSESPEHSEVVELIRLSREEVAAIYSVPPPVLGILDRAIMANVKELRAQYVREAVGPWTTELESELMSQLVEPVPSWRGLFVEFLLAEQLRPDLEARADVHQKMRHLESIDEQRRQENLPPLNIPGASDVPWVASGAMPLSAFREGSAFMQEAARAYGRRLAEAALSPNGHHEPEEAIL
nr:phage portal protein [Acidimicrobiia bacterium]